MKAYVVIYDTNYGQRVMIVNASDASVAETIAMGHGAWEDCEVLELNTSSRGLVFLGGGEGG